MVFFARIRSIAEVFIYARIPSRRCFRASRAAAFSVGATVETGGVATADGDDGGGGVPGMLCTRL